MSKRKNSGDLSEENQEKKQKLERESLTYPHTEGEICHVELPVEDLKASQKFYQETFGLGILEEHPDRIIFKPKNSGCMAISVYKPEGKEKPGPASGIYLYSEKIPALLEKIHNNGGIVIANAKVNGVPENGAMATFLDPDGNRFKLIQHKDGGKDVEVKTLDHKVHFSLKPQAVYEFFSDSKKHQGLSGQDTDIISTKFAGLSLLYGPAMTARNLEEATKNKRIVWILRSWDWPQGHYGKFTVELTAKKGGTDLHCTVENVPADKFKSIDEGLYFNYWNKFGDGVKKDVGNYKGC